MRIEGYYWINTGEEWTVGEYLDNEWYLTGCETALPERFIKEINEIQIKRK